MSSWGATSLPGYSPHVTYQQAATHASATRRPIRSYVYPIYIPARIFAGTSITFDYDTTDDDLRGDRGGFDCRCGAPTCRGQILGRLFSPRYSPKNSPKYEESESEVDSVVSANLP